VYFQHVLFAVGLEHRARQRKTALHPLSQVHAGCDPRHANPDTDPEERAQGRYSQN
jgi:hypothetical protein